MPETSNGLTLTPTAHAKLGASGASRWMNCPGSIRMESEVVRDHTKSDDTVFAREGTAGHEVAAECLTNGTDPHEYVGKVVLGVEITLELAEAISVYVEHCRGRPADLRFVEIQVNLNELNPPAPMFGTSDHTALVGRTLYVDDLKLGRGVVVEVKDNVQLRYYALGAWLMMPNRSLVDTVNVTIIQPRVEHHDGPIRTDGPIAIEELLVFGADLLDAARKTQDPDAPLHAGEWCRWCKARAVCPEQRRVAQQIAQTDFDVLSEEVRPPAPHSMPNDALGDIATKLPILEQYVESVRDTVRLRLEAGETIPGWKLVRGRSNRRWALPTGDVTTNLVDLGLPDTELFEPGKLRSVRQVELLLKSRHRKLPEHLVTKPEAGMTIARDSDTRPALRVGAANEFPVLLPATVDTREPDIDRG